MNVFITICVGVIAAFLGGCDAQLSYSYLGSLRGEEVVEPIEMGFSESSDEFGGEDALGFTVTVFNRSDKDLSQCTLVINKHFKSPLSDLEIYRGILKGNVRRESADLLAGSSLEVHFSHDCNNHLIVQSQSGEPLPNTKSVQEIGIVCVEGSLIWRPRNAT